MTTNNNTIKSIENDLTAIVKESGISKIILQYKSELEDISNCSECGFKYKNRFWKNNESGKTFCLSCINDFFDIYYEIDENYTQYSSGRHSIYRDVNKFNY
jgi:hypothetical protein